MGGSVSSGSVACPEKVIAWPTCHWVVVAGVSINALGDEFPAPIETLALSVAP